MTALTLPAEQRLRLLLNETPAGVLLADAVRDARGDIIDFRYAAVNAKMLLILGLDNARLMEGQLMSAVFPRSMDEGSYFQRYAEVVSTERPVEFEANFINRLGQFGWYRTTITPHGDCVTVITLDITATKQTERKLQEQTKLLEGVLNSSPAAIFGYAPIQNEAGEVYDFRITLANQAAADFNPAHTTPVADAQWLIGKTVLELSPNSRVLPLMLDVTRTAQPLRTTLDYPEYNRTFEFSVASYGDSIVTTTMDITAIYQQKKLLQTILDISPAGIILYETIRHPDTGEVVDFRYRLTNDTNLKVVGRSLEEITSQTLLTLFPSIRQSDFWPTLVEVAETGQSRQLTFPFFGDGVKGWFEGYFVRQDNGVLFTFIDITRIKEAELERRQQADTLVDILDSVPAAVFVSEAVYDETNPGQISDFCIREVNELGAQSYNLTRMQMVNQLALDLFPQDRHNGIFARYVTVVQTQQPQRFEYNYRVGAISHWLDVRLVPFSSSSVVATCLDITPIKRAQERLEAINVDLKRSNDNLQKFAYVASHDLQEPLRKVQSFGDILATSHSGSLNAEGLDIVRRMQSSAARMSVLIKDLLTYSRLTTQQETFAPQPLNTLISHVLDDLDLAVRESDAQVVVQKLPVVAGDGAQFRQLFQNLIGNALKFRQPGVAPVVSVTHRRVEGPELPNALRTFQDGQPRPYWEICVADNGIGFNEKYADRIFQVFQRLHGRNQYPGTGIGLAICQKVVENHRGAITVSSQEGAGTTFRVYLPAADVY